MSELALNIDPRRQGQKNVYIVRVVVVVLPVA